MTGEHKSDCLTEQKAWTLQIELCTFNNAFKSKLMCFSDSECTQLLHCSTSTFTNTFTNFTCWFMYMFFFLSYYFPSSQQLEWLDRKLNRCTVTSSKRKMTPNESAALEALVHIVQNCRRAENNAELMANMLNGCQNFTEDARFTFSSLIFSTKFRWCQRWASKKISSWYKSDGKQILGKIQSKHDGWLLLVLATRDRYPIKAQMTNASKFILFWVKLTEICCNVSLVFWFVYRISTLRQF